MIQCKPPVRQCDNLSLAWKRPVQIKLPLTRIYLRKVPGFRLAGHIWLGRAWASPTLASLQCTHACVYLFVCLDQPLTVNFKWTYSNIHEGWVSNTATCTSAQPCEGYCQRQCERDWEWGHVCSMHGDLLPDKFLSWCYESDPCLLTRQASSHRQQNVRWWGLLQPQVSTMHEQTTSYTAHK